MIQAAVLAVALALVVPVVVACWWALGGRER